MLSSGAWVPFNAALIVSEELHYHCTSITERGDRPIQQLDSLVAELWVETTRIKSDSFEALLALSLREAAYVGHF